MLQHRISAGAIVEHQGRVLLVNYQPPGGTDIWVAPGGGVNADETLEAAAAREVWEETGLRVRIGPLLCIEDLFDDRLRIVKFWFHAQPLDAEAALDGGALSVAHPEAQAERIVQAAWLSTEERTGRTVFPPPLAHADWRAALAGAAAPSSEPPGVAQASGAPLRVGDAPEQPPRAVPRLPLRRMNG